MTPAGRTCLSTPAALDPITTGWTRWPGQLSQNRTWKEDSASSWKLSFLSFRAKRCIWCYRGTFYFFFLPKGQRLEEWAGKMIQLCTAAGTRKSLSCLRTRGRCWGEKDIQRIKGKYEGITGTTDTSAPLLQLLKFPNFHGYFILSRKLDISSVTWSLVSENHWFWSKTVFIKTKEGFHRARSSLFCLLMDKLKLLREVRNEWANLRTLLKKIQIK